MAVSRNKWLIAFTVMLPTLIEIIDTSIVNVSLDHIRGSLSAGIVAASVSTAPLGARLAHGLPVPKLKRAFALLLLIMGTKLLYDLLP